MSEINNLELNKIREGIDELDTELLGVLEKRFKLVERVAEVKSGNGLPIVDKEREKEVIESKVEKTHLPAEFVRKLYRLIIDTAIEMEKEEKEDG